MTEIYLVRHCEADGNIRRIFHGITDTLPTADGRRQLDFLAERFKDVKLDAVYASPLQRTRATADAVNRYHGLPVQVDQRLIEINGGEIEGMDWEKIYAEYPELCRQWLQALHTFATKQGDSMQSVYDRARTTLQDLAAQNPGKTLALATHGGFIKNALCWARYGDITRLMEVPWPENTSVSLLELDEKGNCTIRYADDASHLPEELLSFRKNIWSKEELNR